MATVATASVISRRASLPSRRHSLLAAAAFVWAASYLVHILGWLPVLRTDILDLGGWFAIPNGLHLAGMIHGGVTGFILVGTAFLSPGGGRTISMRCGIALIVAGPLLMLAGILSSMVAGLTRPDLFSAPTVDYLLSAACYPIFSAAACLALLAFSVSAAESREVWRKRRDRLLLWAAVAFVLAGMFSLTATLMWMAPSLASPYSTAESVVNVADLVFVVLTMIAPLIAAIGFRHGLQYEARDVLHPTARRDRYLVVAALTYALAMAASAVAEATIPLLYGGWSSNAASTGYFLSSPIGEAMGLAAALLVALAFARPLVSPPRPRAITKRGD